MIVNIVVSLVAKGNVSLAIAPWLCYLLTAVPAVISLIIAVVAQAFDRVTLFPMGEVLEKDMIDRPVDKLA